jgi:hypothetical protein
MAIARSDACRRDGALRASEVSAALRGDEFVMFFVAFIFWEIFYVLRSPMAMGVERSCAGVAAGGGAGGDALRNVPKHARWITLTAAQSVRGTLERVC